MSFGSNIEKEAVTTLLRRYRNQIRLKTLKLTLVLAHSTRSTWRAARLKVKSIFTIKKNRAENSVDMSRIPVEMRNQGSWRRSWLQWRMWRKPAWRVSWSGEATHRTWQVQSCKFHQPRANMTELWSLAESQHYKLKHTHTPLRSTLWAEYLNLNSWLYYVLLALWSETRFLTSLPRFLIYEMGFIVVPIS